MKTLKFRAWSKIAKFYVGEDELYLGITFDGKYLIYQDEITDEVEFSKIDDFIIERYTGLKDKNGKKIYEGDIVKVDKMFDAIAVGYDAGGFVLHNEDWDCVVPMSRDIDDVIGIGLGDICTTVEVIGNIHKNPELLGGEE